MKEECVAAFKEIKRKQWKYVIFKVTENRRHIAVWKKVRKSTYGDFLKLFVGGECFYALYDFAYETEDRGPVSKIVFFSW